MGRGARSSRAGSRIAAGAAALLIALGVGAAVSLFTPPAYASVDDFIVESFDAEYTLSRDDEGRSSLTTVEHIVAVFPDFDQNRGLIRDLTQVYDGHETGIEVLSVIDETGAPRDYWTEPYGDFLSVVMAVPEGQYVHGAQHYIVTYTQRDVTAFFDDTSADEFYWDVNGTGWTQPFGRVSARVALSDDLRAALNGSTACYWGAFGSTETCELVEEDGGFFAQKTDLFNGENLTIAIGFEPGTFSPAPEPPVPFLQRVPLLLWAGIASFAAGIAIFITTLVRGRGARTGRAVIAQYEPPQGVSVALSAEMWGARKKAMTASLLDFAVRRKLRLLHHEPTDQYGVQALDASDLLPLDATTYARIFGGSEGPNGVDKKTTYWFSKTSTRLGDAAASLTLRARAEAKSRGLVKQANGKAIAAIVLLMVFALLLSVMHAVITGNFVLMVVLLAVGINLLVWTLIGMGFVLAGRRRVTREGALLLDHLRGLREYIRLAEADRIRMLQSASGAEVDEQFIVHVYELLLPYAVIFGFEREWQGELARYYRESAPDWVAGSESGSASFTRIMPLSGLSQAVSSAGRSAPVYSSGGSGSGSSFSSFSGGSSGGGFSGGGGGGGGGRGI